MELLEMIKVINKMKNTLHKINSVAKEGKAKKQARKKQQ